MTHRTRQCGRMCADATLRLYSNQEGLLACKQSFLHLAGDGGARYNNLVNVLNHLVEETTVADLEQRLRERSYPGRGILVGRSCDGSKAVIAYFIMGRSENSRNRVFVLEGDGIRTQAFDPAKMEDPSLIIYAPVRVLGNKTIVTNGDQTDTIYDGMDRQLTFEQSLRCREFEPDGPNYTPRISAVLHIEGGKLDYAMSILKTDNGDPENTLRYFFDYDAPKAGKGRFISTYENDGNPLPSFAGEPLACDFDEDFTVGIDSFTNRIWAALNEDNKVSLFTRFIDLASGETETRIVNRNV